MATIDIASEEPYFVLARIYTASEEPHCDS